MPRPDAPRPRFLAAACVAALLAWSAHASADRPIPSGGGRPLAVATHPAREARPAPRWYDEQMVERGRALFDGHCAQCHRSGARGTPEWRKRGPDGRLPPPPLNGTAHAWHHPAQVLMQVIMEGTLAQGGSMPPWRDVLSPDDGASIIAYLQSLWPEDIYQRWLDIQARSRGQGRRRYRRFGGRRGLG